MITVQAIEVVDPITRARVAMYVAHGPDGHTHLLKRFTEDAARSDGLAYFTKTRELNADGRWVLK